MNKPSPIFPIFLATIIFALIVWSGINPHDRAVWYAEIIPVASVFFLLVATYRIFRFSNLAYLFMSFWLIMHSIGAYYTFEIIEWQYAVIDGGEAGLEFLGSQGDIWDAQKDMLADTLGALTSLFIFVFTRPDKRLGFS